jgi:hypothetical protein
VTSVNLSIQSSSSSPTYRSEATKQEAAPGSAANSATSGSDTTKVSISGRAMMLSRLFHTSDPNANPSIDSSTTTSNLSGSAYSFLNAGDRQVISKLYEYASSNGIDPLKVDAVAFDLGGYRMDGPSGPSDTAGLLYDLKGNPIIGEFSAPDEAAAQKILTSKAMGDTAIDHGFLRAVLAPTRMPVHASDFGFLQQVVFAFSATGSDGSADPNASPVIRHKKEDFPPIKLSTTTNEGDNTTLLSRLLPDKPHSNSKAGDFVHSSNFANYLSSNDKDLLGNLYSIARKQGDNLTKVDKLATVLGAYRMKEQLVTNFLDAGKGNGGVMREVRGRKQ